MRIKSKFKDYYDGVQGIDQDRELLYVREPVEVTYTDDRYPFPGFRYWHSVDNRYITGRQEPIIQNRTIGFCGRIYPCLLLTKNYCREDEIGKFCYKIDDIDEFVEANYSGKALEAYRVPGVKNAYSNKYKQLRSRWPWDARRTCLADFFEKFHGKLQKMGQTKIRDHFDARRSPVFVGQRAPGTYSDYQITYNGCLKEVEFFRIFDAYQAYQEIRMWLSNQAEPRKPIPTVDDLTLSEAKGFDKFSFRKDPGKKRRE